MISQFSGAVFDYSRSYRFLLWRFWDDRPRMLLIGLNPSTANEISEDPTIRRGMGFAHRWGYGGMYWCNVLPYCSTDPKRLTSAVAVHKANIPAIQMAHGLSVLTVCCWGDGIELAENGREIAEHVKELVQPAMCFGLTQKGNPTHPLYLKGNSELVELPE